MNQALVFFPFLGTDTMLIGYPIPKLRGDDLTTPLGEPENL